MHALSLRQPWAALVVAGLKTIEVRSWPTRRLGRVLIHAAKLADNRPEALQRIPLAPAEIVKLRGGIVGEVQIVACVRYPNLQEFLDDQAKHLNDAAWFQPPRLYGFVFSHPKVLPFRAYAGQNRFFTVADEAESGS